MCECPCGAKVVQKRVELEIHIIIFGTYAI